MNRVFLGLGTNLGKKKINLKTAIQKLNENKIAVLKCSSFIETDPVGGPPQDTYLNAVAHAMGEYSIKAAPGMMVGKKWETHPTEIADLHGTRLAIHTEFERGQKLADQCSNPNTHFRASSRLSKGLSG